MDDIPPSYKQATTRDYWAIVSSYVRSEDLCAAALVSKRWNEIFMPRLWGNPASHFGTQNDAVYVALVRFKRTLSWARPCTRELTHTVHLPPAHAEIYDGPHADWLRELLWRLPKLQSLIVKGLPFFDHGALATLKHSSRPRTPRDSDEPEKIPTYNLRLLDASYCLNTTSPGLEEAFKHFPALTYLDVSGTYPAKDRSVLANLKHMPQLQILKARSLSLKDDDINVLADAIGCSIRSLDLRDNYLTDHTVRILLDRCFKGPKEAARLQRRMIATVTGDWPSTLRPQHGVELLEVFKSDRQDSYVRNCLTSGFVSYLGFEHVCGTGITHLYVSGNQLTIEGISGLIRSRRLHALDVGTVLDALRPSQLVVRDGQFYTVALPGAEKLIPVFHSHGQELTYLRIDHAIVTKEVLPVDGKVAELEDTSGIVLPPHLVELDADGPAIREMPEDHLEELPAEDILIAELEGSPVSPSPTRDDQPNGSDPRLNATNGDPHHNGVRRGSIFAPEVVENESPILTATGGAPISPTVPTITSIISPRSPNGASASDSATTPTTLFSPLASPSPTQSSFPQIPTSPAHLNVPGQPPATRKRTYSNVRASHEAHTSYLLSQPHALIPPILPSLQTLILTGVPAKASPAAANDISTRLITFVTVCATEARWARLRAEVGYTLPPHQSRKARDGAVERYARELFALRRVVLEVAADAKTASAAARASGWRDGRRGSAVGGGGGRVWAPGGTGAVGPAHGMSSVEDPDCEVFWSAARADFSFFGDEECGQPDSEAASFAVPLAALTEKVAVTQNEEQGGGGERERGGTDEIIGRETRGYRRDGETNAAGHQRQRQVDVLAELGRFRKVKRYLHDAAVAAGRGDDEFVEGYWDGEIVVVRPGPGS